MKMQVNISRIEEIVGDDTDMKKMLIKMFIESCGRCIFKLQGSVDNPGPDSEKIWHDVNHELKGAAYNLGFNDLGDLCKKNENTVLTQAEKQAAIDIYENAKSEVEIIESNL